MWRTLVCVGDVLLDVTVPDRATASIIRAAIETAIPTDAKSGVDLTLPAEPQPGAASQPDYRLSGIVVIDGLSDCEAAEKVEGALRMLPPRSNTAAPLPGSRSLLSACAAVRRCGSYMQCARRGARGLRPRSCRTVFSARASAESPCARGSPGAQGGLPGGRADGSRAAAGGAAQPACSPY